MEGLLPSPTSHSRWGTGVLGLLGPNGAGKTTLMQMIATITAPTSGSIRFDDVDLARDPDHLRRRLGYLPQDFGECTTTSPRSKFLTYFAALKGVRSPTRVMAMLELVNLHTVAHRRTGTFSGGMKQRLGIAQALINDPELVIVDEPTAGARPRGAVRFRNILSDIGFDRLVIFSTHIVSDIESIATEIAVMKQGPAGHLRSAGRHCCRRPPAACGRRCSLRSGSKPNGPDSGSPMRCASPMECTSGSCSPQQPTAPFPDALPVEPDLEDAFLSRHELRQSSDNWSCFQTAYRR